MRPLRDVEIERAVLGGVLMKPGVNDHELDTLRPSDFTDETLRAVFAQMVIARAAGTPLDTSLVSSVVRAAGGSADVVPALLEAVASHKRTPAYALRLRELGGMRELMKLSGESVVESAETFTDAIAAVREALDGIERGRGRVQTSDMDELATLAFRALELRADGKVPPGLPLGVEPVDRMLGGMARAGLYIVAARPGCGKSSLLRTSFAHAVLSTDYRAQMYSLEMTKQQVMDGVVCAVGHISAERYRRGDLEPDEWGRASRTFAALAGRKRQGQVEDSKAATLEAITATAKAEHARAPLDYIFVDYLQLVRLARRVESREQQVSAVARGLKHLATDLNCVVVAASQLNRDVEKRSDKRPLLSDLRESGEIEQAADGVIMLHREGDAEAQTDEAEAIIRKHRHGPSERFAKVRFVGQHGRFDAW